MRGGHARGAARSSQSYDEWHRRELPCHSRQSYCHLCVPPPLLTVALDGMCRFVKTPAEPLGASFARRLAAIARTPRSIAPEPEGGSSRAHPHPCWSATGRRQQPPDQRPIFSTSHQRAVPFHPPCRLVNSWSSRSDTLGRHGARARARRRPTRHREAPGTRAARGDARSRRGARTRTRRAARGRARSRARTPSTRAPARRAAGGAARRRRAPSACIAVGIITSCVTHSAAGTPSSAASARHRPRGAHHRSAQPAQTTSDTALSGRGARDPRSIRSSPWPSRARRSRRASGCARAALGPVGLAGEVARAQAALAQHAEVARRRRRPGERFRPGASRHSRSGSSGSRLSSAGCSHMSMWHTSTPASGARSPRPRRRERARDRPAARRGRAGTGGAHSRTASGAAAARRPPPRPARAAAAGTSRRARRTPPRAERARRVVRDRPEPPR